MGRPRRPRRRRTPPGPPRASPGSQPPSEASASPAQARAPSGRTRARRQAPPRPKGPRAGRPKGQQGRSRARASRFPARTRRPRPRRGFPRSRACRARRRRSSAPAGPARSGAARAARASGRSGGSARKGARSAGRARRRRARATAPNGRSSAPAEIWPRITPWENRSRAPNTPRGLGSEASAPSIGCAVIIESANVCTSPRERKRSPFLLKNGLPAGSRTSWNRPRFAANCAVSAEAASSVWSGVAPSITTASRSMFWGNSPVHLGRGAAPGQVRRNEVRGVRVDRDAPGDVVSGRNRRQQHKNRHGHRVAPAGPHQAHDRRDHPRIRQA